MTQESFRNWQTQSIQQKQTSYALLLGLSGAALAFAISQLSSRTEYIGFWHSLLFQLSAAAHLLSMTAGVAFSLNRVRDFDLTSQIARTRETDPTAPRLASMRKRVRRWGRITRTLFVTQAFAFTLGTVLLLAFVTIRYSHILYWSY